MINMKHNRKLSMLAAAVCMVATGFASAAKVEGMEKLERMGEYKTPLVTYHAAKPSREHLALVSKTAAQLSDLNDIRLNQEHAFSLGANRIGYTSDDDPSASFEVDRLTGNFLFNGGLKKYRRDESTRDLPSEGDAVEISQRWLQEIGLAPYADELKIAHVGGLNMSASDGKTGSVIYEKLKTVRFSRVLDGLPVAGDARIIMQLGESGKLAGMIYQWPEIGEVQKLGSRELLPAEKLQSQARDKIESVAKKALSAQLKAVDLVLYDDGLGVMEPAYHVVVERYFDYGDKEPTMIPFDFYVPTTIEPQAFYPYMEVAELAPQDGRDEGEIKNDRDE